MEVGRASCEPAEDRTFNFADMVKLPIDQSLPEVGGHFAFAGRQTGGGILPANRNLGQVAQIQSAEVDGWRGWIGVSRADI